MKNKVQISHQTTSIIIDVIELKSEKRTLFINELILIENTVIINITHNELTTMLDFTHSSDFQVLYLDKNYYTVGVSFAINNEKGFKLQTQEKNVLLVKLNQKSKNLDKISYMLKNN